MLHVYRTLQIVRGGKLLWYAVIHWKTFVIMRQSCLAKAYFTGYVTGKVLRLLIDSQNPQNFSIVNDLQYKDSQFFFEL